MDKIQQIADVVQKGLQLIVWASVQQGRTRLTRLRNELYNYLFHALSCGLAKCQCCIATVTVVVYRKYGPRLALLAYGCVIFGTFQPP